MKHLQPSWECKIIDVSAHGIADLHLCDSKSVARFVSRTNPQDFAFCIVQTRKSEICFSRHPTSDPSHVGDRIPMWFHVRLKTSSLALRIQPPLSPLQPWGTCLRHDSKHLGTFNFQLLFEWYRLNVEESPSPFPVGPGFLIYISTQCSSCKCAIKPV